MTPPKSYRPLRVGHALVPALALGLTGCAFSDGQPWGELVVALSVESVAPPERLDPEGRLITANDYALTLDHYTLTLDGLSLRLSNNGSSPTPFDPSRPPPGYSLCHNGHCHRDDGALVTYADVAAAVAGAQSEGAASLTLATPLDPLDLGTNFAVPLGPCPGACAVDRGSLSAVTLGVLSLSVEGRAFDRRSGDAARLPAEGVPFQVTVALGAPLLSSATAAFGRDEPAEAHVHAVLQVPASLWDSVDWSTPVEGGALAPILRERLQLSTQVTR